jgi:hypothetical protein
MFDTAELSARVQRRMSRLGRLTTTFNFRD